MNLSKISYIRFCLNDIGKIYKQVSEENPRKFILIKFHRLTSILLKAYGFGYIAQFHDDIKQSIIELGFLNIEYIRFLSPEYFLIICKTSPQTTIDIEEYLFDKIKNYMDCRHQHFLLSISSIDLSLNTFDYVDILHKMLQDEPNYSEIKKYKINEIPTNLSNESVELSRVSFLKNCFQNGESAIYYQPIFDVRVNKISYYECLLRVGTETNVQSAAPYIISAEKLELSHFIDNLLLENMPSILNKYPDKHFSFNLSSNIAFDHKLKEKLKNILSNQNYSKRIIIEITETANYLDMHLITELVCEIKKLGAKTAIDDFGVGSTNFAQIKNIPIDIVKIDGSFIKDILENKMSKCFVNFVADFAKIANLDVVAEFVENKEISDYLTSIGIYKMQGYYYSKPTAVPE